MNSDFIIPSLNFQVEHVIWSILHNRNTISGYLQIVLGFEIMQDTSLGPPKASSDHGSSLPLPEGTGWLFQVDPVQKLGQ